MALTQAGRFSQVSNISRSLRFAAGDSAYLNRTPGTASNRKTFTISTWVKRAVIGTLDQTIFSAGTGANRFWLIFNTNHALQLDSNGGTRRISNALFRDTNAWYHIVCAIDTSNATGGLRQLLYVNGVQITSFSTSSDFTLNADTDVNSTAAHAIGRNTALDDRYFNGYMVDTYLIDGLSLNPNAFGFFDNNNIWQPKTYNTIFGLNGFYLDFSDDSSTSNLGLDRSGNANNWTTNNFSVTSGIDNDSLLDSPNLNYCIINDNDRNASSTVTQGGLFVTSASNATARGAFRMDSGKWYFETVLTSTSFATGAVDQIHPLTAAPGSNTTGFGISYTGSSGEVRLNNTVVDTFATASTDDVVGVAVDLNNNKVWFRLNGAWLGSGWDPATNTGGHSIASRGVQPLVAAGGATSAVSGWYNFGQRSFANAAPLEFLALNSTNFVQDFARNPAFQAVLYTGNGTTLFTRMNFTPSMVWTKLRNNTTFTCISDQLRDAGNLIFPGSTAAPSLPGEQNSSFNGLTVRQSTNTRNTNTSPYVAYGWVRAPQYGFDIVRYIGNNTANRAIPHKLNATPEFIIVKRVDTTGEWYIWHRNMTSDAHFTTFGSVAESNTNTPWGTGAKTETSFTVTNNATNNLNAASAIYIAYIFRSVPGYSDFGAYVGNANTAGTFCNLNFRPSTIIVKNRGATQPWTILDSTRGGLFNPINISNNLGAGAAEVTTTTTDLLSNGVRWRINADPVNASATYLHCAWSEAAFKYARAR
jgi:hypothetical protein